MKKTILYIVIASFIIFGCSSSKNLRNSSFSSEEQQLIMNADSITPMRVYKITDTKDSLLLRRKSAYVKPNLDDVVLQNFVKRLYATVRDSMSLGVGIAAPQVGVLKNIIWVQRFDKENFPFEVYLNPEITDYSKKKQTVKEGCLSIPDRSDTLNSRSYTIAIEYDTMEGKHKSETIDGFTSVVFQHEIDHLNGILYLDHLEKEMNNNRKDIQINWVENLEGDFSFRKEWSYKEGVYKNKYGQLSCDGICPPEIDRMKDENGRIYKDSLSAFYKLVDTTHIAHTFKSNAKTYEYSGTNFIEFKTIEGKTIGKSLNNVSTHSSLNIIIQDKTCNAWIDFNSITDQGNHKFMLVKGNIEIDKRLFNKGIMKAVFNFRFKNTLDPERELSWNGLIYSKIKD